MNRGTPNPIPIAGLIPRGTTGSVPSSIGDESRRLVPPWRDQSACRGHDPNVFVPRVENAESIVSSGLPECVHHDTVND